MPRVSNKIALVTGGSRGIGAATATLLVQEGAQVIILDILDNAGSALVDDLGKKARYVHGDVSKQQTWEALSQIITRDYGHLDIVFNNAGISGFEPELGMGPQDIEQVSLSEWQRIHAVNLDGVFLGCKYAIQHMRACGGSIINMSSRSGMVGISQTAAYCSSKGAIRNLTKSVAMHCAEQQYKIRCNSLHPGAIYTPIWDAVLGDDPAHRETILNFVKRGIPLGKMGTAQDVAQMVLFLASDESGYMTGSELVIDGGIMAGSTATLSTDAYDASTT